MILVMMNNDREIEWLLREKYNGQKSREFYNDVSRIEKGEPVDYVIGFSCFLGAKIDLSFKPLIPRVETEYWVEKALADIKNTFGDKPIHVLDIFSGSGCIGIATLMRFPNAHVDFVDIDESMAKQIQINLELNSISKERYSIFVSNVLSKIPNNSKYDVVLANPPYVDKSRNVTDESVLKNEPHRALFADNNGMALVNELIQSVGFFLKEHALVYIEHDDDQVPRIQDILNKAGYTHYEFYKDQFGLSRYLRIQV